MTGFEPELSVIMPVGTVDVYLTDQLDALEAQQGAPPWELICSLNNSDPGQGSTLQAALDARPALNGRLVDSSAFRSAAHARNVGAQAATSGRLAFCDSDDLADPRWVAAMVAALQTSEAVGGHLDEKLLAVPGQENWRPPATPSALPQWLGQPYLVSANMGVRRSWFERVGGFDTTLIRGEDIGFSWSLLDNGVELSYAPQAVIHYRHRKGLGPMLKQHYLYGRGFSQILARRDIPQGGPVSVVGALRPNRQPVVHRSFVHYLRRASIATGRIAGLWEQGSLHLSRSQR